MSRSNPNANAPNPAVRWFEWNGEHGHIQYYDKDQRKRVELVPPFSFLLLDELASVRGWDDDSDSGIYSNAVKDTRTDILVVKSKGGIIAEGIYKEIKDKVNAAGGYYVANCYIAFKDVGDRLAIAVLQFKGASLKSWMEYRKANRGALYSKAIDITGYTEGKKGKVVFRMPTFAARDVSAATDDAAKELDRELQAWLESYFSRRTADQSESHESDDDDDDSYPGGLANHVEPLTDDDIPF